MNKVVFRDRPGRAGMRAKSAAVVALLTVSALATACGGSDGGGDPAPTSKPTGQDDSGRTSPLEPLIITQRELKGHVVTVRKGDATATPRSLDGKCEPLAASTGFKPSRHARDTVSRGITKSADPTKFVTVSLSSYAPGGAKSAKRFMKELKTAVAACASGFDTRLKGEKGRYSHVREIPVTARGDDSIAYAMTARSEGHKVELNLTAVRSGRTVAFFAGLDMKNYAAGYRVPQKIIDRQVAKLQKHRGEGKKQAG